jgi:FkbM family methyltransferase
VIRDLILRSMYSVYLALPSSVRGLVRASAKPLKRMLAGRDSVVVDGLTMYLDVNDPGALIYAARVDAYERSERQAFRDVIRLHPGCTVIDLGAQFGIYSLTAAATRAPGRILAVEASPRCAEALAKSLGALDSDKWTLFRGAIGARPGKTTFWLDQQSSSDNRGFQQGPVRPGDVPVEVEVQSVDGLRSAHSIPADGDFVVKIDVQGAEGLAIEGMSDTIAQARSLWLFMECGADFLESAGSTTGDIASTLATARLTHAWRVEKAEAGLTPVAVDELLDEIRRSPAGVCEDYVFARDPDLTPSTGSRLSFPILAQNASYRGA